MNHTARNLSGYYVDQLLEDARSEDQGMLNDLKFEIDKQLYYFGSHFREPIESKNMGKSLQKAKYFVRSVLRFMSSGFQSVNAESPIFCNAYFNLAKRAHNLNLIEQPWFRISPRHKNSWRLLLNLLMVQRRFNRPGLAAFDVEFFNGLKKALAEYYAAHNPAALFVPTDLPFLESVAIRIFAELGKPSFNFLHGLPGYYDVSYYNRKADYLVVWGKSIKEQFIRVGAPPAKILISGHPRYSGIALPATLRNSSESILVLTKSVAGAQSIYPPILHDRSITLSYAMMVARVLRKRGVKSARLRPHPSENPDWYKKHLDSDFFVLDTDPLDKSLRQSSLVIGPSSSVFIDALFAGVNYSVFEPIIRGKDLANVVVDSPFDGSNRKVPVASKPEELFNNLAKHACADAGILNDYVAPELDLSGVLNKIFRKQKQS